MHYLLLIYDDEIDTDRRIAEDPSYLPGYGALARRLTETGELKGGNALQGTATATSVRVRDGELLLTDGPFAETREQLGGFFLIEARDLDRAIEIARQIPAATHGTIEIRPIRVMGP
jgi:hypothetical protein